MQKNTIGSNRYGEAYSEKKQNQGKIPAKKRKTKAKSTLFISNDFFTDSDSIKGTQTKRKIPHPSPVQAPTRPDDGVMYFLECGQVSPAREIVVSPAREIIHNNAQSESGTFFDSGVFPLVKSNKLTTDELVSRRYKNNGGTHSFNADIDMRNIPKSKPNVSRAEKKFNISAIFATFCIIAVITALVQHNFGAQADVYDNVQAENRIVYADANIFDSENDVFNYVTQDIRFYIKDGISAPVAVTMPFCTIGEALGESGIIIGGEDGVNYPLDYMITDNITVNIDRISHSYREAVEKIPYASKVVEVDTIPKGTTRVHTKGSNGTVTKYYEQTFKNGELISETPLKETKSAKAVDEVVYKGVGGTFKAPNGKTYEYSYKLTVDAVAYGDPSDGTNPNWKGMTYSGIKCAPGVLAVDPRVIPLLSKVYVTGAYADIGECIAADTGSAIKGNIIDIFMTKKADMIKFGRRKMTAYILE